MSLNYWKYIKKSLWRSSTAASTAAMYPLTCFFTNFYEPKMSVINNYKELFSGTTSAGSFYTFAPFFTGKEKMKFKQLESSDL